MVGEYIGLTIPCVGYAIVFATSKQGALLVLILPGVLLVAYSVFIFGDPCGKSTSQRIIN
ncbi:hypothetical protein [Virgibacillus salidurans]|uniref:hypothetical protein n=1 Tax=Virgibacillus salidurans TaxID=2831673 RepID=UPI00351D37CF